MPRGYLVFLTSASVRFAGTTFAMLLTVVLSGCAAVPYGAYYASQALATALVAAPVVAAGVAHEGISITEEAVDTERLDGAVLKKGQKLAIFPTAPAGTFGEIGVGMAEYAEKQGYVVITPARISASTDRNMMFFGTAGLTVSDQERIAKNVAHLFKPDFIVMADVKWEKKGTLASLGSVKRTPVTMNIYDGYGRLLYKQRLGIDVNEVKRKSIFQDEETARLAGEAIMDWTIRKLQEASLES